MNMGCITLVDITWVDMNMDLIWTYNWYHLILTRLNHRFDKKLFEF